MNSCGKPQSGEAGRVTSLKTNQSLAGLIGPWHGPEVMPSIGRRFLYMIDDDDIDWRGRWHQLESKLLLQGFLKTLARGDYLHRAVCKPTGGARYAGSLRNSTLVCGHP